MHTKTNTLKHLLCVGVLALAQQGLIAATKPVIWSAAINSPANVITIIGEHFAPTTGTPAVTLDSSPLTLQTWSNTMIVANSSVGLGPGTYALTVSNGTVATVEVANYPLFGTNTSLGVAGSGATCTLGEPTEEKKSKSSEPSQPARGFCGERPSGPGPNIGHILEHRALFSIGHHLRG
jgi:hypothetical protein